jgi:mannosylglycerate hydrolase
MSPRTRIHVVTNTHWDREHRHGFQETNLMLADVMERVAGLLESTAGFEHFILDGQSVPIDDCLEIRPDLRERLAALVKAGTLHAGPWYTLVDAGSVTPECIIRNLLKGRAHVRAFGGEPMPFGYSIFSFGQISQLPQIYAGFGIHDIIFYKGYHPAVIPKSEFIWEAPDGTQALASRLGHWNRYNFFWRFTVPVILGGDPEDPAQWQSAYDNGRRLTHMVDAANKGQFALELDRDIRIREALIRRGVEDTIAAAAPHSYCPDVLLGFDGIDFSMPVGEVAEALRLANATCGDIAELIHSTPMAYFAELRDKLDLAELPVHRGEMRMGPVDAVHTESMSANIEILRALGRAERTLLRNVEPLAVWNMQDGRPYPHGALDLAWRYLFQVHAHDSAHGLGDSKIKRDSLGRIDQAQELGSGLARRALEGLVARFDTASAASDDLLITVYNPAAVARGGVAELHVDMPAADHARVCRLETLDGKALPCWQVERAPCNIGMISPENRPKPVFLDRFVMDVNLPEIPALGYRTIRVVRDRHDRPAGMELFSSGQFPSAPIARNPRCLDNGLVRIDVQGDGTVTLTDHASGERFDGLFEYVDGGCRGDCWVHHAPDHDRVLSSVGSLRSVELVRNNNLRATVAVVTALELPVSLTPDREQRSTQTVAMEIRTEITVTTGSKRVDVRATFDNRAKDHVLRVRIPTGIPTDTCVADAPFDVIERTFTATDVNGRRGPELARNLVCSFADVSDGQRGLALFTKTSKEFGLEQGDLLLSLLRAVDGRFPVDAQVLVDQGDAFAQCLGPQEFEFALLPHGGDWNTAGIPRQIEPYLHPVVAIEFGPSKRKGTLPLESGGLLGLEKNRLFFHGVKPAEDGNGIIVRLANPGSETVEDTLHVHGNPRAAQELRLDETPLADLAVNPDGSIPLRVGKGRIFTVAVRF